MSDMTKELGLPWKVSDYGDIVDDDNNMVGKAIVSSDTNFILTACNSYHAMREALEYALTTLENDVIPARNVDDQYLDEAISKATEALKGADHE